MATDWDTFLESLVFTREPTNPILVRGGSGAWDEYVVADPSIIEEATELRMYYSANGASGTGGVGLATSPKTYPPITWTKQGKIFGNNPTPNQWDSGWVRMGSILKVDGTYYLYYAGSPSPQEGGTVQIGLATSSDGINFTRSVSNPIITVVGAEYYVGNPAVVKVGTSWYMYFGRRNGGVLYDYIVATSSNGISWTRVGTVLSKGVSGQWDDTYLEHCQAYYLYDHYVIFYEGYGGSGAEPWCIGVAYNVNPTTPFTRHTGNPVFTKSGASGSFDEYHVATPAILIKDNVIYLFFQGGNAYNYGNAVWDMGIAYGYMGVPPTGEKKVINLGKGWGFRRWSVPQYKWV